MRNKRYYFGDIDDRKLWEYTGGHGPKFSGMAICKNGTEQSSWVMTKTKLVVTNLFKGRCMEIRILECNCFTKTFKNFLCHDLVDLVDRMSCPVWWNKSPKHPIYVIDSAGLEGSALERRDWGCRRWDSC